MAVLQRIAAAPTRMAATPAELVSNIHHTRTLGLPRLEDLSAFNIPKGKAAIAIVAGGPSLRDTIEDVRRAETVMVCGSAHDFVVKQGIKPTYAVLLDVDPIMANYVTTPCPETTYLVASQCHPDVFKALEGCNVVVWNCAGGVDYKEFGDEIVVAGGSTVTLRGMTIAVLLGYSNIHFYGFDSCVNSQEDHHAYEAEPVRKVRPVRVGDAETGELFWCAPYQISQAMHFQDFIKRFGHLFTVEVHGGGLIAAILAQGQAKADAMDEDEQKKVLEGMRETWFPDGNMVVPGARASDIVEVAK